jgi:hypothetical protein
LNTSVWCIFCVMNYCVYVKFQALTVVSMKTRLSPGILCHIFL